MIKTQHPQRLLSQTLDFKTVFSAIEALQFKPTEHKSEQYIIQLHQQLATRLVGQQVWSFTGGRAALNAVICAMDLPRETTFLLPAFGCQSVHNAIVHKYPNIVFVDIELETYGMDANDLLAKMAKVKTTTKKVLFLQYSFGLICRDMDILLSIAQAHSLFVIEDCAHALGAHYQGQEVGQFGDVAIFSSERSKLINTVHGGFVSTGNVSLGKTLSDYYDKSPLASADFTRSCLVTLLEQYLIQQDSPMDSTQNMRALLRNQKTVPQMFEQEFLGERSEHYFFKLPESLAKLLLLQLDGLEKRQAIRRQWAEFWQEQAQQKGWLTPTVIAQSTPAWLRYPIRHPDRDMGRQFKQQILQDSRALWSMWQCEVGVWFCGAIHPKTVVLDNCPNAILAAETCLNLPTY